MANAGGGPECELLKGVRVFDWTLFTVGPFATMLLGALGAEVIKFEGPGVKGDRIAPIPPYVGGMGALYINHNMNKRNVVVDLGSREGYEATLKLLATCDVFVNNMRRETPIDLGLSYEQVSAINPRIVYVHSTGYGHV